MTNEELAQRIQSGEHELAEQLLEQNSGMIYRIARKYLNMAVRNRGADMPDLIQTASVGVLEAVSAWDESRGAFLAIAIYFMQNSLRRLLGINTGKVRVENAGVISLSAPVGEDADITLEDLITDPDAVDPCEAVCFNDCLQTVRAAINELPPELRECMWKRFYLGLPLSQLDKNTYNKAMREVRKNRKIQQLYCLYDSAIYQDVTEKSFKHTFTSSVESAAIKREWIMEKIKKQERCRD